MTATPDRPSRTPSPAALPASSAVSVRTPPFSPLAPGDADASVANRNLVERAFRQWKERNVKLAARAQRGLSYWIKWFAVALILLAAWLYFKRHVHELFDRALIVGAPLTLWSFFELIRAILPKGIVPDDRRSFVEQLVQSPNAWYWISVGGVSVLLLHGSTASVTLMQPSPRGDRVTLSLSSAGGTFDKPLMTDRDNTRSVRQYWWEWEWLLRPAAVRFEVVEPVNWRLKKEMETAWLRPFTNVVIRYPEDFVPAQLVACRLIPGKGMANLPRFVEGERASELRLDVRIKDKVVASLDGLTSNTIYIARNRAVADFLHTQEGRDKRISRFYSLLRRAGFDDSNAESYAVSFTTVDYRIVEAVGVELGEKITVVMYKVEEDGSRSVSREFVFQLDSAEIHSQVLEYPQ